MDLAERVQKVYILSKWIKTIIPDHCKTNYVILALFIAFSKIGFCVMHLSLLCSCQGNFKTSKHD